MNILTWPKFKLVCDLMSIQIIGEFHKLEIKTAPAFWLPWQTTKINDFAIFIWLVMDYCRYISLKHLYVYPAAGHVITGNLKIMSDSRIRSIIAKDPK